MHLFKYVVCVCICLPERIKNRRVFDHQNIVDNELNDILFRYDNV